MNGRSWTESELKQLERLCGVYTVSTISKMIGRPKSSINKKMKEIGLGRYIENTDMICISLLARMLGVDQKKVKSWKPLGLKGVRHGRYLMYHQEDIIKFMKNHPDQWNAAHVTDDSIFYQYDWFQEKKKSDKRVVYNWTTREERTARFYKQQGYKDKEIAAMIGRSLNGVKGKFKHERKKLNEIKRISS